MAKKKYTGEITGYTFYPNDNRTILTIRGDARLYSLTGAVEIKQISEQEYMKSIPERTTTALHKEMFRHIKSRRKMYKSLGITI